MNKITALKKEINSWAEFPIEIRIAAWMVRNKIEPKEISLLDLKISEPYLLKIWNTYRDLTFSKRIKLEDVPKINIGGK